LFKAIGSARFDFQSFLFKLQKVEMRKELTAAIIAGGLSERFGEHKLRIRIGDKEMIDYAIQLAKALSNEVLIIHGEQDDYADKNLPHVADVVPRCGPIGGVYTALRQANSSFIATIPADVPLLPAEVYELLFLEKDSRVPVVAVSERGMEPLVSIWPRDLVQQLGSWIRKGNFSLHEFLRAIGAREVSVADRLSTYNPAWFLNINFQKDLKIIKKRLNLE